MEFINAPNTNISRAAIAAANDCTFSFTSLDNPKKFSFIPINFRKFIKSKNVQSSQKL